jgi:ABC-type branched-subunit amino acid transport system ATPase component
MKSKILTLKNVSSGYGEIKILKNISLDLNEGEILGILGRNGMGKSTLIKTISGLIKPYEGSIYFKDQNITNYESFQRAKYGITTVLQGRGILSDLTVFENLIFGKIASGGKKKNKIEEVFNYFPSLKERIKQKAGTLSGGEQQMLAIGRGLMTNPVLFLLDEPSDGIMPKLIHEIGDTILKINKEQKLSFVIVEQNLNLIKKTTQGYIVFEKGEVVKQGITNDIIKDKNIIDKYLSV